MRYLWRQPIRMDNARLRAALDQEPDTPLDKAVEATLVGLGCFTAAQTRPGRRTVTSWTNHVLPSGSLKDKNDP